MSVKVMTAVFERYPSGGGEMILALALADHADDEGARIFPSVEHLMSKTRQSRRTVQYQLRRMEHSGWLILVKNGHGGRGQSREYRINPNWINGGELSVCANGAESAPIPDQDKHADCAPFVCADKGATGHLNSAMDNTKGAIECPKGRSSLHPHITIIESSMNRQESSKLFGLDIPDWLDPELWRMWHDFRKLKSGKAWIAAAQRLSLRTLTRLYEQGQSPAAVIEQSIERGWTGLFAVKNTASAQALNAQESLEASNREIARRAAMGG
ncbi:MAG TPA: helix-turn-helix domain-containing protein [Alcaligenes sp.]|nr:helix-turn-helix domain-containing protein [Alcaligenes sp.]